MNIGKAQLNLSEILNKAVWAGLLALFLFAWNTNGNLTKFEEDLKFYRIIFERHEKNNERHGISINEKLASIEMKEDKMQEILQEIITRLKVIEYELKINGKK